MEVFTPPLSVPDVGSGFRVEGSGFRVQVSGFRVQGSGSRGPRRCAVKASTPPSFVPGVRFVLQSLITGFIEEVPSLLPNPCHF